MDDYVQTTTLATQKTSHEDNHQPPTPGSITPRPQQDRSTSRPTATEGPGSSLLHPWKTIPATTKWTNLLHQKTLRPQHGRRRPASEASSTPEANPTPEARPPQGQPRRYRLRQVRYTAFWRLGGGSVMVWPSLTQPHIKNCMTCILSIIISLYIHTVDSKN